MITIRATVNGTIRFPEHLEREGAWGLIGGEDVQASRRTFRSVGEAMTWARRVLDGEISPRWEPAGDLVQPHTAPAWHDARVHVSDGSDDLSWGTDVGRRTWHELRYDDSYRLEVARDDGPAEVAS